MYLRLSPYQEILQGVLISLQINEGIIKIIGKAGAGKTAFCNQLFQELQAAGQPAVFFLKPPSSAIALQNDILDNLKIDPTGNFTRTLTTWLLARSAENKLLVLIFDDAQQLDAQTFSAIRMLCNIQDQARGLVRVVVCGNEELDAKLATPALRAVTQFLNQSFTLPYLTQEQVRDFCQGWWQQTGQDMKPLGARALERLFNETKGHPGILQARLSQGTTGAEPAERQAAGMPVAPARPYRYRGRKPNWIPALAIVAGLLLAGAAVIHLYLSPQPAQPDLALVAAPPVATVAQPAEEPVAQVEPATADAAEAAQQPELDAEPVVPEPAQAAAAAAVAPTAVQPTEPVAANGVVEPGAAAEAADVVEPAQAEPTQAPDPVLAAGPAEGAEAAPVAPVAIAATEEDPVAVPALPPVDAFIAAWTMSWQSQDVDAYLAHYHPEFVPAQGTRADWEQQRRRVISSADGITISVDTPEFIGEGDGAQVVRFWLNYSAANYADRTLKELVLVPVDGAWRIRAETNLRTARL